MSEKGDVKIIYCVRHGQTHANVNDTVQGLEDPLTPEGEIQAEKIAKRATRLSFEHFVASDAVRAVQTASVIAKRTGKTFETSPLFRERKSPTSLIGVSRADARYLPYKVVNDKTGENMHFEDEENFFDFKARVLSADDAS